MQSDILNLLVLAVALSPWTWAQQNTTSSSPQQHASAVAPTAVITTRGCISGAKRYTFMQTSTGAMFELSGETDRFVAVRGKLVEITGDELAPQPQSGELPTLKVNSLRVVADKCPIQARASSATANSTSANKTRAPSSGASGTTPYTDPGTESQTPPNVENPNVSGATGAPSPGTGNPPAPPQH